MARSQWLNQLLGGIAGGAQGYSQQQQLGFERDRLRQQDLRQQQQDASLNADRESERLYRAAEAKRLGDQATKDQSVQATIAQHWAKALGGDAESQAAIVAVAPHLADRFIKPPATPNKVKIVGPHGEVSFVDPEHPPPNLREHIPAPPQEPLMQVQQADGSVIWLPRSQASGMRAPPRATTAGMETPQIAATRRDLKDFQSQQIRAEQQAKGARAELHQVESDRPAIARHPLSELRNAADSSAFQRRADIMQRLADAETRTKRLTTSADSTQGVLSHLRNQLNAGSANAIDNAPAPGVAPSAAPDVARIQRETDGFTQSVAAIKQQFASNPAEQQRRLTEAQRIYNARLQKLNAGQDPDSP